MNNNCKFAGSGCCMCSACQSMRETLENLSNMNTDKIFDKKEVRKIFKEMEQTLEDCKCEK